MDVFKYALQDLKRQKVKTIFGISGIAISILLLTIVGCLADSLSYSYLDQATNESGSSDIVFQKLSAQDFNFDPYFDQNIVEDRLRGKIEGIETYYPRLNTFISISHFDNEINKTIKKQIIGYGINSTLEQDSGAMGNLWLCDDNAEYDRIDELFKGPIKDGSCILTRGAARLFNLKVGDVIDIKYASYEASLSIQAIVDQDLRFSRIESTLIIFELHWLQQFMNQIGKVNSIHTTLANPELIYDTRDVQGTTREMRLIAEQIQIEVGFEFSVTLPKLQELQNSEQQTMTLTMTFSFISFFSMLITGILINSILTTSVEERVREFGVLRVLGGKRKFTFKMVLISGIIMSILGTFIGTLVGALAAPPLLTWTFTYFQLWRISLDFIILPITILRSILIGVGVTSIVSIIPAMKAGKVVISDAIDPSRNSTKDEYKITKEGTINGKLMGIGLGIAAVGIFLFLILPRLLTGSGGPNVTNYVLIGLLLAVLIGLVFATIGFVPVLEGLIANIFKPFMRKYYPVYRINLYRYRRRNLSTIVMFSLTFSFIFFISSQLEMQSANSAMNLQFQYGADLVMSNSGNPDQNDAVNMKLYEELQELPGIKNTAIINHNSLDMTRLTSMIFSMSEDGFDGDMGDFFGNLFGDIPKYEAYIGDIGGYNSFYSSLIGIDENYYETVDQSLLMWDRDTGSSAEAINQVMQNSNHCIIAKILADHLGITELPADIRITMSDPDNGGYKNISVFTVVGVSRGMPGVWNFRSSELSLNTGAGILVNLEDYSRLMNWGEPTDPEMVIDKILINLANNDYENIQDVQTYIENYFGDDYDFLLEESVTLINMMEENNNTSNLIMQAILFFSILVSLFGLIASMYSTLMERMYEIGIMRAMGLKPHEMRSMLMFEAVTVMLSSGSLGAVVGWLIAYLMQTNVAIISEMPVVTAVNIGTLLSTFLVSITISIVGMFFITRKVEKWSIIEVLRSTF
ncbi:hypothetical protein NEF87_004156 [Candidatus Lokiarchaeum ossiferum]|uniref:ABC3 transporter permease C-terminal domain-containing protein n=1 Tax=Candidatus Lokiarchaeum ossiferum TaxID=2951803 RepID=A0ABY6HWX3_9ARCH|nr:hypothetical protein NEF87_004156 [Candidatus Lokiarchaeum sp. B-35]